MGVVTGWIRFTPMLDAVDGEGCDSDVGFHCGCCVDGAAGAALAFDAMQGMAMVGVGVAWHGACCLCDLSCMAQQLRG